MNKKIIMSGLAILGVVATGVTTYLCSKKETAKNESEEKYDVEKTTKDVIIEKTKTYGVPIALGLTTVGCIVLLNKEDTKKIVPILSSGVLASSFGKDDINKMIKEVRTNIKNDLQKRYAETTVKNTSEDEEDIDNLRLFYDETTEIYFTSTIDHVVKVEREIQDMLISGEKVPVEYFYEKLNLYDEVKGLLEDFSGKVMFNVNDDIPEYCHDTFFIDDDTNVIVISKTLDFVSEEDLESPLE